MIVEQALVIPADHPALAGHFPGDPIVPGVVMLDRAAELARDRAGWRVVGVRAAKFKSPLRPGTDCVMHLSLRDDGALDLLCRSGETTFLTAILDCAEAVRET